MEDEGDEILLLGRNKNIADQEQYPASNEIQERCVNILASLFNSPSKGPTDNSAEMAKAAAIAAGKDGAEAAAEASKKDDRHAVGTSTVGSSEAIMLAGLAMKWRWRQWRAKRAQQQGSAKVCDADNRKSDVADAGAADDKAASSGLLKGEGWATSAVLANKSYGPGSGEPPCNLIISAASHVSLLKTCKYLDIEVGSNMGCAKGILFLFLLAGSFLSLRAVVSLLVAAHHPFGP
jgi:glutamate/tyrosine decarboxylase-like PLP-dependent enzyme